MDGWKKGIRAGYFVAHELGHCVLHSGQLVRLAQMPTDQQAAFHRASGRIAHKAFEDTEWQANAFAGALLMPAAGLAAFERESGRVTVRSSSGSGCRVRPPANRLDIFSKRRAELLD